jgi:cysteine dioxygenase
MDPRREPCGRFVTRLQEACADGPDAAAIDEVLADFRPTVESLAPWIAFDASRYTRTRLHRSDAFELLLLCWDRGQATPVHDHDGQAGWFTVLEGALGVQEYDREGGPDDLRSLAAREETAEGALRLHEGRRYVVEAGRSVAEAEGPETIHRVGPVGGRALSLHLYAGPLDSFLVFDAARGTARRLSV